MATTKHTPGGSDSLLTRPNTQPAKGHWATYQAHTTKAHHGDYTGAPRSAARLYLQFDNPAQRTAWIKSFSEPRYRAIAAAAASVGSGSEYGYIDFMLLGLSISRTERQQIQVAQNDNFVEYYFGSSPSGIQLQGLLYDTLQDDWNNNWFEAYWYVWRGTLLARRRQLLRLRVYDRVYAMTVASASESLSASNPMGWSFSLTGTLYSVTRLPDPVLQHTNPTDVKGLLTSGATKQASSIVGNARSTAQNWTDLYSSVASAGDLSGIGVVRADLAGSFAPSAGEAVASVVPAPSSGSRETAVRDANRASVVQGEFSTTTTIVAEGDVLVAKFLAVPPPTKDIRGKREPAATKKPRPAARDAAPAPK